LFKPSEKFIVPHQKEGRISIQQCEVIKMDKRMGRKSEDNGEPFKAIFENWNYIPRAKRIVGKW
jgi:hypothetical protein